MVFCLTEGKVVPVSLEGKTTYQNHPEEFERAENGNIFVPAQTNLNFRNRFTSDCLNHLFESFGVIAHAGGFHHFDFSFSSEPVPGVGCVYELSEGLGLQYLVKADKKTVYDLFRETCKDF